MRTSQPFFSGCSAWIASVEPDLHQMTQTRLFWLVEGIDVIAEPGTARQDDRCCHGQAEARLTDRLRLVVDAEFWSDRLVVGVDFDGGDGGEIGSAGL